MAYVTLNDFLPELQRAYNVALRQCTPTLNGDSVYVPILSKRYGTITTMASLFALPVQKVDIKSEDDDLKKGVTDFKQRPKLERSKFDIEVAKYLRFNVPKKNTMMQKQPVEYFVGSKAVDVLMASQWAVRKKGRDQYFVSRDEAAAFLDELLQKQFFYRVMKTEHEKKKKDDKKDEENKDEEKQSQGEEKNNLKKRKKSKIEDAESEEQNGEIRSNKKKGNKKNKSNEDDKKNKEKTKKRYKLTYHEEQVFLDFKDIYIWVYNPVSWKTIAKGIGLLLLVAGATLFPLWPDVVRIGVYYLSVAAGIFIGSVFVVALLRTVLFGALWLVTGGKHHLWLLPNLLEDVGFFESFKPLYSYEYKGPKEEVEDEEEASNQESASADEEAEDQKLDDKEGDTDEEEEGSDRDRDSQSEKISEHTENETAAQ